MLSCFWSSAKKSPEEPRLPERRVLDESHKPAQQLETPASGYPFSDDPGSWLKEEEEYYPKTRETARKHIEWLRAQKRVDKPDRNARALNAALKQSVCNIPLCICASLTVHPLEIPERSTPIEPILCSSCYRMRTTISSKCQHRP